VPRIDVSYIYGAIIAARYKPTPNTQHPCPPLKKNRRALQLPGV